MTAAFLIAALAAADDPAPKPAAPPPLLRRKEAAAPAPKAKLGKDDDAPPQLGEERGIPKPGDAKRLGDDDAELLRELGRDPNADQQQDPLLRAGDGMRKAEELLAKLAADLKTLEIQDAVVKDLEELLKDAENPQQQQQQKKKKKKKQDDQKKDKQEQTEQQKKQQQQKQSQQAKQQKSQKEAQRAGSARLTAAELAALKEKRDYWGHLPEAERQLLEQSAKEEKLPEFRTALEKYYSKIAEESGSAPRRDR